MACDERREPQVAERLIGARLAGESVALVSDAGMPLIADPGRLIVARALAAGCEIACCPGASAVETALVASGLAAEGYAFLGWVPRAAGERARFLAAASRRRCRASCSNRPAVWGRRSPTSPASRPRARLRSRAS